MSRHDHLPGEGGAVKGVGGPHYLPVTRIEAATRSPMADLKETWRYRELLYHFVWRDVKIRYRQTAFGVAWAVIQPLGLMVVFTVVLGRLPAIPSDGLPYPLFAYCGLVVWTFVSQSVRLAAESLTRASALVSKVYFPRVLLPLASIGSFCLDFVIALGLLAGMMVVLEIAPGASLFWLPLIAFQTIVLTIGIGVGLSALNARYRDIGQALPFALQVWLFSSPIAYSSSIFPKEWHVLSALNPLSGTIEGWRWVLLDARPPSFPMILGSAGVCLGLFVVGILYFQRVERSFADVI